jgi:hypothetical protein
LDISEDIKTLIGPLEEYENVTKAPILTVSQGKYYISNINKNLMEAINDIELNDDPSTLYQLSRHGILIDENIIGEDELKLFASQYLTKIDLDELVHKIDYLKKIGISDVYINSKNASMIDKSVRATLHNEGITIHGNADNMVDGIAVIKRTIGNDRTGILGLDPRKIGKIIHITNSRPVDIK